MKAIDIVKTSQQLLLEAIEENEAADALEAIEAERHIEKADSRILMKALYERGVKLKDIFGAYYELEAMADARTIDVEDTLLTAELSNVNDRSF